MVDLINLMQHLTTPHPLDRYLELAGPMFTARELRARITRVDRSVPGSLKLTLRPTRQWTGFRAGQYVQLGVVIDGVRHTRCYSPVNAQHEHERRIDLTIRVHEHGLVSQYLYRNAEPDMVLDLVPAAGEFYLPQPRPEKMLLISGGSGITPVLAMLRTLAAEQYRGQVVFLHYAKSAAAVAHHDELAAIAADHPNVTLVMRYSDRDGVRFDRSELARTAPWFAAAETYLCGPSALSESVREVFRAADVAHRLHTEEFTGSLPPLASADISGETTFSSSGVAAENTGTSLLAQAEEAGLNPAFGCRMGICFSCTAVRRSGYTRDMRTGEVDADPDQPIQLCVNAAVGDADIEI